MHFVQSPVASTPHPQHANRLRDRPFNPRSLLVCRFEFPGLRARTSRLQGAELWFGNKTDLPPTLAGGTMLSNGTGLTEFHGELGLDRGFAPTSQSFFPLCGRVPLWTGHSTIFKVDMKMGDVKRALCLSLPATIRSRTPQQINAIVCPTGGEDRCRQSPVPFPSLGAAARVSRWSFERTARTPFAVRSMIWHVRVCGIPVGRGLTSSNSLTTVTRYHVLTVRWATAG